MINLYDFAIKKAQEAEKQPPSLFALDLKVKQLKAICVICNKQCKMHTSQNNNTYLANEDLSPHRKGLDCVNSWDQYNGN